MESDMRITLALSHTELEMDWGSSLVTAHNKGYPMVFDDMVYWVLWVNDKAIAYTGSLRLDDFVFVGNTYVRKEWRSKGLHKYLLNKRNYSDLLKGLTKITILNPIESVNHKYLESVVSSLGYTKVESFVGVEDIMHQWVYEDIARHNVWRLDGDSGENEEE